MDFDEFTRSPEEEKIVQWKRKHRLMPEGEHSEALFAAVCDDDFKALGALLEKGANPDTYYMAKDKVEYPRYLLHVACDSWAVECVRTLVEAGAKGNCEDMYGRSPLHYCCTSKTNPRHQDCARELLTHTHPRRRLDVVNHQDHKGKTPLHVAARHCNMAMMKLLLYFDALINLVSKKGDTPLMLCARLSEDQKTLLQNSRLQYLDTQYFDSWQFDTKQHQPCLRMLIDAGAELNTVNSDHKSALDGAVESKQVEVVRMLLKARARVGRMTLHALRKEQNERIKDRHHLKGFQSRASNNVHDKKSLEWMKTSILQKDKLDVEIAKLLLEAGAEVTPDLLTNAARSGHSLMVRLFLQRGANPDTPDNSGSNALLEAVNFNWEDCVLELLRHNASMTLGGLTGVYNTRLYPVECAVNSSPPKYNLIKLFLLAGYDISRIHHKLKEHLLKEEEAALLNRDMHGWDLAAEVRQWLTKRLVTPSSLKNAAVISLRRSLGPELLSAISTHPLPSQVKKQLILEGVLTEEESPAESGRNGNR